MVKEDLMNLFLALGNGTSEIEKHWFVADAHENTEGGDLEVAKYHRNWIGRIKYIRSSVIIFTFMLAIANIIVAIISSL